MAYPKLYQPITAPEVGESWKEKFLEINNLTKEINMGSTCEDCGEETEEDFPEMTYQYILKDEAKVIKHDFIVAANEERAVHKIIRSLSEAQYKKYEADELIITVRQF